MRGREIDIHHRAVGEVRNLVQAGDRWDQRPPAHIDEDAIGLGTTPSTATFFVPNELAVAFINSAAFQRLQRALDSPPRCACDGILARLDRPHINPDGAADRHPVVAGAARQISRVYTRDERLGRRASGIDASAAEEFAFDHGHLLARSYKAPRQ